MMGLKSCCKIDQQYHLFILSSPEPVFDLFDFVLIIESTMPQIVADLHLHSHFSRATSKDLTLEQLWRWAQLKGVSLIITGDIAHPGWLKEIRQKLEPAEGELFKLKDEISKPLLATVPPPCRSDVRFLLGGEVSNIYKKTGATRKVHHMLYLPDLASVERLQARLERCLLYTSRCV